MLSEKVDKHGVLSSLLALSNPFGENVDKYGTSLRFNRPTLSIFGASSGMITPLYKEE